MNMIAEATKIILAYLKTVVPDAVCRRSYLPVADVEELEDAGKPVIFVVPIDRKGELYRPGGVTKNDLTIDIIVNAKLQHRNDEPESLVTEIDTLIGIAETIYAAFHKKELTSGNVQVAIMNPEHLILNDMEMIQEQNCFLSAVRVNVKTFTSGQRNSGE